MSKGDFWQVTVRTTPEGEVAVAGLLQSVFHESPSVYTDEDTKATDVTVYVHQARHCSPDRIQKLRRELTSMAELLSLTGKPRVRVKIVRKQDWAESWKRHFKALDIRGRLLVKPSWIKRKPRTGQLVITLDPGLSFGTGHHPTTSFCLGELVRANRRGSNQSMLDIGTGSGLLAIAAAKLGYAPVKAFDNDPESIRVAEENLTVNGVRPNVKLVRMSLEKLRRNPRRQFDMVCANLLADLLIRERDRIAGQVAPGGCLVIAGILTRQFNEVRRAFGKIGFKMVRSCVENEWHSGTLRRRIL